MGSEGFEGRPQYQKMRVRKGFSDEEMARDWTLSDADLEEVNRYRKSYRVWYAVQLCAVRLYGRFVQDTENLSSRIINYLAKQLDTPPTLRIEAADRKATYLKQRQNILVYLGFSKFDADVQNQLETWVEHKSRAGMLPDELFVEAESYLLDQAILLPGATVLARLITRICAQTQEQMFELLDSRLPPGLKSKLDELLILEMCICLKVSIMSRFGVFCLMIMLGKRLSQQPLRRWPYQALRVLSTT